MSNRSDTKYKLSDEEIREYKTAIEAEGHPTFLHKEKRPNQALKLLWTLNKKYNLTLRLQTEVTEDGYLQYRT